MKRKVTRKSKIGYVAPPETEYIQGELSTNGGGSDYVAPPVEYTGDVENGGGMNASDVIPEGGSGSTVLPTLYNAGDVIDPLPKKQINWPLLLGAAALLYFLSKQKR